MSPYVRYRETLKQSHIRLQQNEIIRVEDIKWINSNICGINVSFRKTLVNIKDAKNNVINQDMDAQKLLEKMVEIINNINEDWDQNSIIKALLIHHQFEFVHPFTDGKEELEEFICTFTYKIYSIKYTGISIFIFNYARKFFVLFSITKSWQGRLKFLYI